MMAGSLQRTDRRLHPVEYQSTAAGLATSISSERLKLISFAVVLAKGKVTLRAMEVTGSVDHWPATRQAIWFQFEFKVQLSQFACCGRKSRHVDFLPNWFYASCGISTSTTNSRLLIRPPSSPNIFANNFFNERHESKSRLASLGYAGRRTRMPLRPWWKPRRSPGPL